MTGLGRGSSGELDELLPGVTDLIKRVELGLRHRLDEHLRRFGVSAQQYGAISVLLRSDGASAAELARYLRVTPQAMSQLLAGLERRDLIRRHPDPAHGKVLRVSVTDKGRRILRSCDDVVGRTEAAMMDGLTADQRRILVGGLRTCARALGTLDRPGD